MPATADFSNNKPTLPNVGSDFAGSGPYASYHLLKTVPANVYRKNISIENNSGEQIAILIDDGTAATGAAPVNASIFALAAGAAAGNQGGSWQSWFERGRIQVYGPTVTDQVMIREN